MAVNSDDLNGYGKHTGLQFCLVNYAMGIDNHEVTDKFGYDCYCNVLYVQAHGYSVCCTPLIDLKDNVITSTIRAHEDKTGAVVASRSLKMAITDDIEALCQDFVDTVNAKVQDIFAKLSAQK